MKWFDGSININGNWICKLMYNGVFFIYAGFTWIRQVNLALPPFIRKTSKAILEHTDQLYSLYITTFLEEKKYMYV